MDVRAKKYLGQHFLKDEAIAQRIADSLSGDCHNVLEVGPGMGVLTQYLVAKPQYVFRQRSFKFLFIYQSRLVMIFGYFFR